MAKLSRNALNGLSEARVPDRRLSGDGGFLSSLSSRTPQAAMEEKKNKSGLSFIELPHDRPPYYFRISIGEYNRESWRKIGKINTLAHVCLPIPQSIVDAHVVDWEGSEIGAIGAGALNAGIRTGNIKDAIQDGRWSDIPQGGIGDLWDIIGGGANFLADLTGRAGNAFGVGLGASINRYLTMMLKGPTYKKHSFGWKMSPNDRAESSDLIKLYQLLNNAAAPNLYGPASAFFTYPAIFQMDFIHDDVNMGTRLYRFKPAVLTNQAWDFGPAGPAFFGETKAPVAIEFKLEFTEIEFWLANSPLDGDFGRVVRDGKYF